LKTVKDKDIKKEEVDIEVETIRYRPRGGFRGGDDQYRPIGGLEVETISIDLEVDSEVLTLEEEVSEELMMVKEVVTEVANQIIIEEEEATEVVKARWL